MSLNYHHSHHYDIRCYYYYGKWIVHMILTESNFFHAFIHKLHWLSDKVEAREPCPLLTQMETDFKLIALDFGIVYCNNSITIARW